MPPNQYHYLFHPVKALNMSDILQKILTTKHEEVAAAQTAEPLRELRAQARDTEPARDFIGAIRARQQAGQAAIIAEIKKASPSKGLIREDFHPAAIAAAYAEGGAACMSVLTDRTYFQGCADYLQQARAAAPLPALRKDFIIDPYQIYQARAWGADAVLLIAAALSNAQMHEFEALAHELGMAVLLELHEEREWEKCQGMQTPLWGVNNRNLRTFEVNLQQTLTLLPHLRDKIIVTESGIFTPDDIRHMQQHGVNAFLIGESLMRATHISKELAKLVNA